MPRISNEEALQRARGLIQGGYEVYSEYNEDSEEMIYQELLQGFPWILGILGVPPKVPYPPLGSDGPFNPEMSDLLQTKTSQRAIKAVETLRRGRSPKPQKLAQVVIEALSQGILMENLFIKDDEELLLIINLALAES